MKYSKIRSLHSPKKEFYYENMYSKFDGANHLIKVFIAPRWKALIMMSICVAVLNLGWVFFPSISPKFRWFKSQLPYDSNLHMLIMAVISDSLDPGSKEHSSTFDSYCYSVKNAITQKHVT